MGSCFKEYFHTVKVKFKNFMFISSLISSFNNFYLKLKIFLYLIKYYLNHLNIFNLFNIIIIISLSKINFCFRNLNLLIFCYKN